MALRHSNMRPVTPGARGRVWAVSALSALALLSGATTTPAAALGADLHLSPAAGHPLLQVTARGLGFGPSEIIDVSFDTQLLKNIRSTRRGQLRTRIIVPASALPGAHVVVA